MKIEKTEHECDYCGNPLYLVDPEVEGNPLFEPFFVCTEAMLGEDYESERNDQ